MPSHQFNQEADTNAKIAENVEKFGVEFTVLEPGDVNGPKTHPLYTWLKANSSGEDVRWNFASYFLIDRSGNVVTRHNKVSPASLAPEIERLLAEPKSEL